MDPDRAIYWTLVQYAAAKGSGSRRFRVWYHRGMLIAVGPAIGGLIFPLLTARTSGWVWGRL